MANYQKPLSSFLDQYSTSAKNMKAEVAQRMETSFKEVMDRVDQGLGKLAFRLYDFYSLYHHSERYASTDKI